MAASSLSQAAVGPALRVGLLFDGGGLGYGVFVVTRSLLRTLDRALVQPVGLFLGTGPERDVLGPLCDELCDLGCGCVLPLSQAGHSKWYLPNLVRKGWMLVRSIVAAGRAIRRLRLEVLHVHAFPLHLIAGLACWLARVPCIWHWHGSFGKRGASGLAARLGFRFLADRVVCISRHVFETLPRVARGKAVVVYNGVDVQGIGSGQRRGKLRSLAGARPGELLVGIFGSLTPYKGHENFLHAAAAMLGKGYDVRFVVVGGENEVLRHRFGRERSLRALAAQLGIADRVAFLGEVEDADLLVGDCDVVCVTTYPRDGCLGEGFGLVTAEAAAAGVPVVGTNCGATPELIEDGVTGLLVPPQDTPALARAVESLLRDSDRRKAMGEAARRRVLDRFDVSRMVRQMEQVYAAVGGRSAGAHVAAGRCVSDSRDARCCAEEEP
ncbi:MAG: glycosyltransferase family 4 protein [Planctomycetes bacterium]|nr:glycosyltransferase family 4 protein [Planctomycetota bacterium]